ncbi:dopey-like leucine zipper transcription factor [Encephalitozoon intestinalis ATCC 50506]|uniref:Dopey-like leucine zipper transcription factor n=1 Tax=Encephalitozoon intestinalis (strain ATCC 50506) TaxID=876142 RepID=E0S867_ENCIT|nr:dopey-like leucine zipper transcription factor [Encephalitozoon intestinalis ATCC 50506]ADM11902.1 dopey-like leucine zipper transcription factor [Encephalitozoon intestinalis ATCC 50506]UTX45658.1 dopey-like protein [Encephalitozoon intestinalis]
MDESRERYEAEMTKKLDAFKTAKEWSDFISLLSSLDNTIRKFSIPEIPKKKLLFKRLNQCLNPVLPAGIHNKTLETYSLVFEKISRENFLKEFDFLTLGLFTFSAHCRILVISSFLDLIEKYIVPLGADVERYSTSILIGLLPPMEFESGEHYSRAHLIVTEFKSLVSLEVFYSSMWSILLNDERLRTSVVNYMLSLGWEEQILGNERLVVRALCAGLGSESTLVVRNCLDLLIFVFPDKDHVCKEDMLDDLTEAVIRLFVKRDLSLNKRIYGWMCMADNFNEADVALLSRALKRFLDRNSAEDIQLFFRIMMTLQDKGKLCEKIMENLLFDVLSCLQKHQRKGVKENVDSDAFEERQGESIDVEKIARAFLTTDLDSIWKIFYLRLRNVLKEAKEKMLLDLNLIDDEELNDSVMREEIYSMHTMSLILNEGQIVLSEGSSLNNSQDRSSNEKISEAEERSSFEEISPRKEEIVAKALKVEKRHRNRRDSRRPTQVLSFIRFAVENYSVVDSEVFHYHLPFLVHLVLSDFLLFDAQIVFSFLDFSAKIMKFKEKQVEGGRNLQKLIGRFYLEEDTSVLDDVSSTILYSISDKIGIAIESNVELSLPLMSTFIKIYGEDVFPSGFIPNYHNFILKSSNRLIKEHLEVYKIIDCTRLDSQAMFDVLWTRFCHVEKDLYLENPKESDTNNGMQRISRRNITSRFFITGKGPHRRALVELLWKYNAIFGRSFEKFLLKRIGEGEVEEISYFLLLKIENFKGNFDFLELYYIINCKLDPEDLVLNTFLCSLTCFDDLFKFLLKKLEDSNIQTSDTFFSESIDLNQIVGVFKCIKNLLEYSKGFKSMLVDSEEKLYSKVLPLEEPVSSREILYRILVHLLVNRKEYDGRDFDLEIIKVLEALMRGGILDSSVMNVVDLSKIVDVAKGYRGDPAIVLGIAPLIKHSGNSMAIQDLCSILDSQCFYYHEFLGFVFSLTDRLQRKVLSNVLFSLENQDFALMIVSETITNMLVKRGVEGELPGFIDKSMKFIFEFFENQYVDVNEAESEGNKVRSVVRKDKFDEQSIGGDDLVVFEERINTRMNALRFSTAKELSSLFFKKVPIGFVEMILGNPPCIPFLKSIDFREQLYMSIMNLYSTNAMKVFKFLGVLNKVMDPQEMIGVFNKSKNLLEKISSYRIGSDYSPLNFVLDFLQSLDLQEDAEALVQSAIINSVYFLQKRLDLKIRNGEKEFEDEIGLLDRITNFKFQGVVLSAVPSLITVILTLVNSNSPNLKNVGIDTLAKLSSKGLEEKYWKKEYIEIFHTLDFFTYRLYKKSDLMKKVVAKDPSIINDLIVRLDSGFFVSQASDANNKTLVLKRISFIIFSAPYNYFASFSLKLIEKIASLINYPSSKVRREVFLLSKMLVLKISHDKLINLYPILLYDIGIIIESSDFEDVMLLAEVLKLLDVVFLLNTPQFTETRVVFLGPRCTTTMEGEGKKPGLENLRDLLNCKYGKEIPSEFRRPKKKIPFLGPGKKDIDEILDFTSNALEYYNWLDENCSEIDYEYLFNLTLEELTETTE